MLLFDIYQTWLYEHYHFLGICTDMHINTNNLSKNYFTNYYRTMTIYEIHTPSNNNVIFSNIFDKGYKVYSTHITVSKTMVSLSWKLFLEVGILVFQNIKFPQKIFFFKNKFSVRGGFLLCIWHIIDASSNAGSKDVKVIFMHALKLRGHISLD